MITRVEGKYWREWRGVCAARGWKSSDSTVRHAMHWAALGAAKSHTLFRNPDWDRVFPFMRRLLDPDDLDAVILVESYRSHDAAQAAHEPPRRHASQYEHLTEVDDPGERKRLCYVIGRLFQPALIDDIYCDRWHALWDRNRDWREMPLPQLIELRDLLKRRLGKFITKVKEQGRPAFWRVFGFSMFNSDTGRDFSNADVIRILLARGRPVDLRLTSEPERVEGAVS